MCLWYQEQDSNICCSILSKRHLLWSFLCVHLHHMEKHMRGRSLNCMRLVVGVERIATRRTGIGCFSRLTLKCAKALP